MFGKIAEGRTGNYKRPGDLIPGTMIIIQLQPVFSAQVDELGDHSFVVVISVRLHDKTCYIIQENNKHNMCCRKIYKILLSTKRHLM